MLEIFALIWLCSVNKKNAASSGKSTAGAIGATIGLWVGAELVGAAIGSAAQLGIGSYVLALLFAIAGGIASYYIYKNPTGAMQTSSNTIHYAPQQHLQPPTASYPLSSYCVKCGNQLAAQMRFCPACGEVVVSPDIISSNQLQDTVSARPGWQTAAAIAATQETPVTTSRTLQEKKAQSRFYIFAVQGPALSLGNGEDVILEKAQKLKDEYTPTKDMELVIIRPHMWKASIQNNSTGGMISVSYNFSAFVDEIRQYLSTKENIETKLIEQGIKLCEENSLQLTNPMSGVFLMGIPIIMEEKTLEPCAHDYKHFTCTKCGEKAPKPNLVAEGIRRQNQYTYEDYIAENAEEAKYFLEQTPVLQPLYYVIVHTPQGDWGKDKDEIFLAQLCDFQKDLSLRQCDAKTALIPERMSDLQMAANKIADNFILSVTCGECGYNWFDGVGYRTKTIVQCPECGKYNLADTENIRFNDL